PSNNGIGANVPLQPQAAAGGSSAVAGAKTKKPSSELGSAVDRFSSYAFPTVGLSSLQSGLSSLQ
uniref:ICA69 domain-containing protein n=1 Tax=Globodera pallida TaxID=36090 RepID=A0A183CJH8_GLOPA